MSRVALYRCTIITLPPDSDFLFHIAPPFLRRYFCAALSRTLTCVSLLRNFFFFFFFLSCSLARIGVNARINEDEQSQSPLFRIESNVNFTEFDSAFKKLGYDFRNGRRKCKYNQWIKIVKIFLRCITGLYRVVIKPGY